jgi:hypothetical protein
MAMALIQMAPQETGGCLNLRAAAAAATLMVTPAPWV